MWNDTEIPLAVFFTFEHTERGFMAMSAAL